jgi:proteic killer suppression protein
LEVHIDDNDLLKLYGGETPRRLRGLPPDVVKKFFAAIQLLRNANSIMDLRQFHGYNFEKLKGNLQGKCSMRLSSKYRLEMDVQWTNPEQTIGIFTLTAISNHYGD